MTVIDNTIMLIRKARDAENNNRLKEAIELYSDAAKLLTESSKMENPEIAAHRVQQAKSILIIAENLKGKVKDINNYSKYREHEISNIRKNTSSELVKDLLPVLDTLDAGIAYEPKLEPVKSQLMKVLQSHGLQAIDAKGNKYDPNTEEVVDILDQGEDGIVLEEVQKGYTLNGDVLRTSKVIVSKRLKDK